MIQSKIFVLRASLCSASLARARRWQKEHVMARLLQQGEWIMYVAFLPGLLASGGIGTAAVMAWHAKAHLHVPTERAVVCAEADDYVKELAKRGIAEMPGYGGSADDEAASPDVIAAAEKRARNAC
jgi:hypothetical protein